VSEFMDVEVNGWNKIHKCCRQVWGNFDQSQLKKGDESWWRIS
jgi:hypothetical protein